MRILLSLISAIAVSIPAFAGNTITVDSNHSFAEALAEARAMHAESDAVVTINVAPGTFRITRPIHLTAEDSHLRIVGAGMGRSMITGTLEAPEWRVGDDGVWVSDLSGMMPAGGSVPQLYVGGRRAVCARTPNGISLLPTPEIVETVVNESALTVDGKKGLAVNELKLDAGTSSALASVDPSIASGRLRLNFLHAWDITRRILWGLDTTSVYYISGNKKPWNPTDRCSQLFFDNDKSFLDAPGEFFYDQDRALLYYIPVEGQDPARDRAQIPCARRIFHVKGTENQRVRDISFEGLTLCGTRYDHTWIGNAPQQGAASSDAAVMAMFADDLHFSDCEITLTGNNGIWLRTSCRDCSVERCHLHDLGIGGVKIGDNVIPEDEDALLTRRIRIDNCIISGGGRELPTGIGLMLFHASDCEITHNEVSDFYYSGMSIGWVWGYAHSPSKRNTVSYNHIHHLGWGLLSDMGGVYTLGKSEGTVVSHNCIHDIYSYGYGGWGLYTDEGSTQVRMEYNLVYNCKSSGFHQHYGQDNVIANNIFFNNLKAQLEATRVEDHLSFTFERNVVCYSGDLLYGIHWDEANSRCEKNIYWNRSSAAPLGSSGGSRGVLALFNGKTLEEWTAATGKDSTSLVADPQFADPYAGDFSMKNRRALKKIGFQPFDYTEAGVYGSPEWKSLAALPEARIALYEETVGAYIASDK